MLSRTTYLNIAVAVLALMLGGPVAHGDDAKSGDRPAGWDKGKKTGWQGDAPPGLEKKGGVPPGLKKKQEGGAGKETAERKPDAKETAPGTPDKKDTGGKPGKKKDKKEKKEKKQKDAAPK